MNGSAVNRRRFERFVLSPMYTPVTVRRVSETGASLEGHAYDVSEGGCQFELDHPIPCGTPILMQVTLPAGSWTACDDLGPGRTVGVYGNVVWCDTDEPGPARMAVAFTRFMRAGDKERLLRQIASGRLSRAA